MKQLDVLFVQANSAKEVYQELSEKFTAVEPPTWGLLLSQSCRLKGFGVAILDCTAEKLNLEQSVKRIKEINPRLVCALGYGQNPNAGTTQMTGIINLANRLKQETDYKFCVVGSHASALPREVLSYNAIDFVFLNEGVRAIQSLLKTDLKDVKNVKGIGWKNGEEIILNEPEKIVSNMDEEMPGYAWDLLPDMKLYRSCNWHVDFKEELRRPYAALYTSLGCQFGCNFCMINIVNRTNNDLNISAADSRIMRFWTPGFIIKEFDKLVKMGITTIRISDEMFMLNRKYYVPLIELIKERGYGDILKIWVYARVDTVNKKHLDAMRDAGIKYLALGVESVDQKIRQEISKGSYKETNIRQVIKDIEESGMSTIANYIFGLPDDNYESMNKTLDTAIELNTEMANFYPCFSLPGSPLYFEAKNRGWELPKTFEGWSFHSYESLPLPTKYLSAAEVLRFRDRAWHLYFTRSEYLDKIEKKFGKESKKHIQEMTDIKIKRKVLGE